MRTDLLGLPLEHALGVLKGEGIDPQVTVTNAPRRANEMRGMLRVVFASDNGAQLTAARFLDPVKEDKEENC